MTLFSFSALPVSRWRNGGGETREICRVPAQGAEFGWRASIATIVQDGAFSAFPGVDRVITLLSGDGVTLEGEGWQRPLRRHEPFAFAGEQAIFARLLGGVSLDFNIMTRRDGHRAAVTMRTEAVTPAAAGVGYVLGGVWRCGGQRLEVEEGMWWTSPSADFLPPER